MSDAEHGAAERRIQLAPQASPQPQIIECGASVSTGGKVQIKKYEISADYHLNLSSKWSMPPGMSEDDAEAFRHEQILRLKKELEPLAQAEVDDLLEQKSAAWD